MNNGGTLSQDLVIRTLSLRKTFGDTVAVRGLTLAVRRGEVFGFLGPNGAGKSSSVKMLLGLVAPDGGEASTLGFPAGHREARRRIGFLPEHFRFYDWLTSAELLRLHGRLYGMAGDCLRRRVPELLERVGLQQHAARRVRDFSKGMLQRVGLAQALLNQPDLIFLDEPTSGLDPAGRRLVRDVIREQRERGATVFLNSHLLSEVEVTCDRVAFIKHGAVLATHDVAPLLAARTRVRMRARRVSDAALNSIAAWATQIQREEDRFTFEVESGEVLPHVLRALVEHDCEIYEFSPERRSLEDLFMKIVGADGGL